jgi:hypothetical protein
MFGMLWQADHFASALSPHQLDQLEREQILGYITEQYRLHVLKTLTGIRFVMITDPDSIDRTSTLKEIYALYAQSVKYAPNDLTIDKIPTFVSKTTELLELIK